jgi:hypothetical protein
MDESIANQFEAELNPDEIIEWCGRPRHDFFFKYEDAYYIPLTLVYGSVLIFVGIKLIFGGRPYLLVCLGITAFLIGLFLIIGRYFYDIWERQNIFYALTNQRILIKYGRFNQNMKSLYLSAINEINIRTWKNGRGTILFGGSTALPWHQRRYNTEIIDRNLYQPGFEMIEDAKVVYDLIKKNQREIKNNI